MTSAKVIWSDLIYVPGPISNKSNCFKLKKLINPVLHVWLYFDGETIGMEREVINTSTYVYGSVFFFVVVVVVFFNLYGTRHVSRLRQINQIVRKFLKLIV